MNIFSKLIKPLKGSTFCPILLKITTITFKVYHKPFTLFSIFSSFLIGFLILLLTPFSHLIIALCVEGFIQTRGP